MVVGNLPVYFIVDIGLLVIWMLFFLVRRDTRKEMLLLSFIFGLAGPLVEIVYINDWWKPKTITNTPIGIEDFIFGFVVGGIASVFYEVIFRKRLIPREKISSASFFTKKEVLVSGFVLGAGFFGGYYVLNLHSFWASILGFSLGTFYLLVRRRDLLKDSLISGLGLSLGSIPLFLIIELVFPGWIERTWLFKMLSGVRILSAPLEDVIWFMFAGFYIGPLYEFWTGAKERG